MAELTGPVAMETQVLEVNILTIVGSGESGGATLGELDRNKTEQMISLN